MRLSTIIQQFEGELLSSEKYALLPSHFKALKALKTCRSEHSPLMRMDCHDCGYNHYVPHSCGHRNCPHCQHHESQQWIERQLQKQMPTRYAMITFTLPAQFRSLAWSHQRTLYSLMFSSIWETLRDFSQNDKQLQGTPGVIAVLHTHNRKLNYHPHIHVIMPMAAINKKQQLWRTKANKYLFSHKALATVFRAKMLAGITNAKLSLPDQYPKHWVVDCRTVGEGQPAIKYLGKYLYRGVIQEKDILSVKEGKVTFRYKDSQTKTTQTRTVSGVQFLWLLLQHVLPHRFMRSRNYGFLHPNSKGVLLTLQRILNIRLPETCYKKERPAMKCPCCEADMRIAATRLQPKPELLVQSLAPL